MGIKGEVGAGLPLVEWEEPAVAWGQEHPGAERLRGVVRAWWREEELGRATGARGWGEAQEGLEGESP